MFGFGSTHFMLMGETPLNISMSQKRRPIGRLFYFSKFALPACRIGLVLDPVRHE